MPLRDRKILTFDVVGTLIDFETGILDHIHGIAQKAGLMLTDRDILEAYAVAEDRQHRLTPHLSFPPMLPPMYREMAEKLKLPTSKGEDEGFRQSIAAWPAFADSVDALKRLKKHFRLVAMTNSDNWAVSHFARTLGSPFDDIVTGEDVGASKPDPQVFAYARGRQSVHGYRLSDYLHVAQSQYHDIGIAKKLGFCVCWIERRKGAQGFGATPAPEKVTTPDYHFASLKELAGAVEAGV